MAASGSATHRARTGQRDATCPSHDGGSDGSLRQAGTTPDDFVHPPKFQNRLEFDAEAKKLIFHGYMSKSEFDYLGTLTQDWRFRRTSRSFSASAYPDNRTGSAGFRRVLANFGQLFAPAVSYDFPHEVRARVCWPLRPFHAARLSSGSFRPPARPARLRGIGSRGRRRLGQRHGRRRCPDPRMAAKPGSERMVPDAQNLDFRDVEAFDRQSAYVLSIGEGKLSRIFKTSDGGQTWALQHENPDPKGFLDALAFWDALTMGLPWAIPWRAGL